MAAELDVTRFHQRLAKLHKHFVKHNEGIWGGADCLLFHKATTSEDYFKSTVLHQWLFRYELPDTIMLLRKDGTVYLCASKKKCEFLQGAVDKVPTSGSTTIKEIHLLVRNKEDGDAANYEKLWNEAIVSRVNGETRKLGVFLKERKGNLSTKGNSLLGPWEERLDSETAKNAVELVDVAPGVSFAMSIKDESELDLMKKSSVLSNKVMKHGCVKKLENIMDSEVAITNEGLADYIESVLEDPTKIKVDLPEGDAASCYSPIVQSGGTYDLRVSALSSDAKLSNDIIIVSLGARYLNYCSNIGRTFLVDPPKKVQKIYEILLEMQETCVTAMKHGSQLKDVYATAVDFLKSKPGFEYLVQHLPKTLGFAIGLDFREGNMTLSAKNQVTFKKGMVFCLSVGFQNLELVDADKENTPEKSPVRLGSTFPFTLSSREQYQIKKLTTYALQISDTVAITTGVADVLTKMTKSLSDVSYLVNDKAGSDEDDDDDGDDDESSVDAPKAPAGDAALARKMAKERGGTRTSSRLAKDPTDQADAQAGVAEREKKQIELMRRRNLQRVRELAKLDKNRDGDDAKNRVDELMTYGRTSDYPDSVQPNQVKVDMVNQCVILPICGNPIPFHISTIKNIVMPEDDTATLLRINFYSAGQAVGKDAPVNMAKLVAKYAPYATFIRELTFRSLEGHNLTLVRHLLVCDQIANAFMQAFRQISELRKRARQVEIREQQEATLVTQEKLIQTKNERVPKIADVTMRPVMTNRKTQGVLEAHANGLRFRSNRAENLDVMYKNIKYAIFQPCESEIMVLIHFHLKNPIMIGKKKHSDVQFFTEVIDASQAVENSRRSHFDPDEMDDEQRERQLRKKLNSAFKDFCKKVIAVAKKNGHEVEFDMPYRDLGFTGNPHREMVQIFPTLNCLVNLTETPFFVVDLGGVDHVHFERVNYTSKAFDMVLVNRDFTKQPWRVDMIPNADKDTVQEWLTDMELTYTEGPMNLNWKQIMNTVNDDDRFYLDTEEDEVTEKDAGWEFLRMFGKDDEDEDDPDEDDSEFSDAKDHEEEPSDDESEVEDLESEDDDDDFDGDEELEEQGMDWDEMEEEAAISDKKKRAMGEDDEPAAARKPSRRGNSEQNPKKKRRH